MRTASVVGAIQPVCSAHCCGIDVHVHVVPEVLPTFAAGPAPLDWPSMAVADECHRHVMVDNRVYRTVSDRCWDVAKRIADMDRMGVERQVLSPMPELLSYWMERKAAGILLGYINDVIADMVACAPTRFSGLGAVPLQDPEAAITELERCMKQLGLAGVEIGSNVNGRPIGDRHFDAFFAAAVELDAAVFVHALRPAGMDRLIGPAALQQVLGYPTDVGLAAASMITSGLAARFPTLRLAFSHGGGTLGLLLPRLEQGWKSFPALSETVATSPTAQARGFFYDSLVYDAATLRHLVSLFGATRVMVGTDYPFTFQEHDPLGRLAEAFDDPAIVEQLAHRNARVFLGRREPAP